LTWLDHLVEYFDIPGPLLMSDHCPKSLYTTECGMILNISFQTVHNVSYRTDCGTILTTLSKQKNKRLINNSVRPPLSCVSLQQISFLHSVN